MVLTHRYRISHHEVCTCVLYIFLIFPTILPIEFPMSPPPVYHDVSTPETSSYGYLEAAIAYPTFCTGGSQHPAKDDEHQPLLGESVRVKYRSSSRAKALVIIACIACTTGASSLLNGHVIVALPMMAHELGLNVDLVLWFVPALPVFPSGVFLVE